MSRESLQTLPFTADGLKFIQPSVDAWVKQTPDQQTATVNDYQAKLADWQKNIDAPYGAAVQKWQADDAAAKAAGQPEPPRPTESQPRPVDPNGEAGWYTTLYNGMINPLIPYAIKGALWYQGESNGGNDPSSDQYGALLESMITDWRARWGVGNFPFLVVGIANFSYRYPDPVDEGWARVREGEVKATEKLPNVAVAEAIDIGEMHGIHPVDKMDVARRLTAAALHLGYGRKNNWSGPTFARIVVGKDHLRIKFNHTADGLMIGVSPHIIPDNPALPTDHLVGFAIAGDDRKWVWADAKIVGDDVVLSSPQVPHPVAARYGWADDPAVNLYNKEGNAQGLPAEPFRTDNWPFVSPPNPPEKW
jgi:sialate O-acetylesterase